MRNNKKIFAYALIIFASLCFGSYGVWARGIGDQMDLFYQVWARGLITAALLLPFLCVKKLCIKPNPSEKLDFLGFLVASIFIPAPIIYAYNHMSIGGATLLFFFAMTVTMIISGLAFFQEKVTKYTIFSLVVGLLGLVFLSIGDMSFKTFLAPAMALLSGAASGLEISLSQKLERFNAWYLVLLSWSAVTVVYFLLSILVGENITIPIWDKGFNFLIIYSLSGILGFAAIVTGARQVSSSTAGFLSLLEVVFGVFFGYLLFNEQFSYLWVIGGILILIAVSATYFETEKIPY